MSEKKSKKKKIRFKGLVVVFLMLYLIGTCVFYLWKMPIKITDINGNYYLKDNYIINYLNIEDESIFKVSKKKIKNKLLELDLISGVAVTKDYLGKMSIEVTEDKILFYNWNNKKVVIPAFLL